MRKLLRVDQPVYFTHQGREEKGWIQGKIIALNTVTYLVRCGQRVIRMAEADLDHPFGMEYENWVAENVTGPTVEDLEKLPVNLTWGAN